ncbi:ABC-2 transporter permease [Clostridium tagluense]|uniref:ABC-2 transporter permease n=1 Tax=Clostridium tagluense TaxID=360422 RepID=UPI001C6EDCC7|nr:ABC-2 transporter permease [Clostridium tagluense]MBW9158847.1 ABC-2 transporter permease [Clostridium tagluense]WLC65799.1 ABC-2 transporter permease [Clostridium tagluense]
MLNLIIKDIAIQKKTLLYALLYSIFAPIAFFSKGPSGLGLYVLSPVVTAYMLISFAVSYDEKNKSEIVLNSLPLKRDDIVLSKYISVFVFAFIGIIYSILVGFIGKATGLPVFVASISLLDIILVLTSVCIFTSIFFPVYFKFGYIKMNIFNVILVMSFLFVPTATIEYAASNPNNVLVQKINYFINNTSSFTQNSLAIIICLIIFLISLMISIRIYKNKEF